MIATMTSKGQVMLPAEIRKRLNLKPGMKLQLIVIDDERMEMVPVKQSVSCLKGMVSKPSTSLSIDDMKKAIAEGACS